MWRTAPWICYPPDKSPLRKRTVFVLSLIVLVILACFHSVTL